MSSVKISLILTWLWIEGPTRGWLGVLPFLPFIVVIVVIISTNELIRCFDDTGNANGCKANSYDTKDDGDKGE
jgi:hypothetical protein